MSEAIKIVENNPKPLALYLFTYEKNEETVLNNLSFGGGCINDTIIHLATSFLPFDGIGESGIVIMAGHHLIHLPIKKVFLKKG